ncbi:unnamed protein product [marine sediment metagenome]|uniref:Uncharacterized protein n=1 Tax=marine sediment metagenome TaxID=412755 RepID=X0W3J5_9ZZZZ
MKCVNCGFEQDGWIKITNECELMLKMTTTKDSLAYIILEHNKEEIGTFTFDDVRPFSYHARSYPFSTDETYKVLLIKRKGYHTYFEVYKKMED